MARPIATRWRCPPDRLRRAPVEVGRSRPSICAASSTRRGLLGLVQLRGVEPDADVLAHRHVRVDGVVLEHHRDVAALGVELVHHPVADPDRAARDLLQPGDHPQRRRLAAARGADEDDELAVGDVRSMPWITSVLPKRLTSLSSAMVAISAASSKCGGTRCRARRVPSASRAAMRRGAVASKPASAVVVGLQRLGHAAPGPGRRSGRARRRNARARPPRGTPPRPCRARGRSPVSKAARERRRSPTAGRCPRRPRRGRWRRRSRAPGGTTAPRAGPGVSASSVMVMQDRRMLAATRAPSIRSAGDEAPPAGRARARRWRRPRSPPPGSRPRCRSCR